MITIIKIISILHVEFQYIYHNNMHTGNNKIYPSLKGVGILEIFYYPVGLFNKVCNLSGIFGLNPCQKYIPI